MNFLSQENSSCHKNTIPAKKINFLSQENNSSHKNNLPITGTIDSLTKEWISYQNN